MLLLTKYFVSLFQQKQITMFSSIQISVLTSRMVQSISFCKERKMVLGDMFEYVGQVFDLNNIEINNIFNKVFFSNFKMDDFKC